MVEIKTSKFQAGVTGADNCFDKGDVAIYESMEDGRKHKVIIDSKLMRHEEAPGDGLVYECILDEDLAQKGGLDRCCLSADHLTPALDPKDFETNPEMERYIQRCRQVRDIA